MLLQPVQKLVASLVISFRGEEITQTNLRRVTRKIPTLSGGDFSGDPTGRFESKIAACQWHAAQRVKKVLFIQKTASHTVGAYKSAARPFCVQNGIANGDNYLFSSKIPTIAAQLLGGRQIAAPTASQQDFCFFDSLKKRSDFPPLLFSLLFYCGGGMAITNCKLRWVRRGNWVGGGVKTIALRGKALDAGEVMKIRDRFSIFGGLGRSFPALPGFFPQLGR